MRILYVHQYFVTPDSHGGTRSYEFARRLIERGHEVHMLTSSAMLPDRYRPTGSRILRTEISGIPCVIIRVDYANDMSYSARIGAFLRFAAFASLEAVREHPEVVFATSTPLTVAIPGVLASRWRRVPLVLEVRDLWPELPIAVGALRNPLARLLASSLELLAYRAASRVVALSPGIAAGVRRRGISPDKVTVIPNGCDNGLFAVPPERGNEVRRRLLCDSSDQPVIVYAGAFGRINGVRYLVDVAADARRILPEAKFLLVGSGMEFQSTIDYATDRGVLGANLAIWKPVPKNDMPSVLAAATIATSLFVPLEPMWNNSANKFFDALAAGKPVAINYEGWQADLLRESGAGVVLPSKDPTQAAHSLAIFLRDATRLKQAAVASRLLADTVFARDRLAQDLEEVLVRATTQRRIAR